MPWKVIYKNGKFQKIPLQKRGTVSAQYGTLRGKVIKAFPMSYFVQINKMNEICNIFLFDKSQEKENRIGAPVKGKIFEKYSGRPLYTAWNELISDLQKLEQ